jgi:hypothetical protein
VGVWQEPLPKVFHQETEDTLVRTSRLGPGLYCVSGREGSGLSQGGSYSFTFRPRAGKSFVVGLSDGSHGAYPLLPASYTFQIEYHSSGTFRHMTASGVAAEVTLSPFGVGGAFKAEGDEIKLEVEVPLGSDEGMGATFTIR